MWLTGVRVNHRTDFGHVIPRLFTRAFVLAWFANGLLNLAAFLFLHLPGIALFYGLDRQDDDRNELDAHGGMVIKG